MDIATAKAEAITRTGLPHTHKHTHTTLPWQHDIKSLPHRLMAVQYVKYIQGTQKSSITALIFDSKCRKWVIPNMPHDFPKLASQ